MQGGNFAFGRCKSDRRGRKSGAAAASWKVARNSIRTWHCAIYLHMRKYAKLGPRAVGVLAAGLDARAAAIVMRSVRNIVSTGRTIVCEHPRSYSLVPSLRTATGRFQALAANSWQASHVVPVP